MHMRHLGLQHFVDCELARVIKRSWVCIVEVVPHAGSVLFLRELSNHKFVASKEDSVRLSFVLRGDQLLLEHECCVHFR